MKAMESRPSIVSLKLWIRETSYCIGKTWILSVKILSMTGKELNIEERFHK